MSADRYGPPDKTVAVVVPLSLDPTLSDEDEIAVRHILHFLPDHDRYMVAPEGVAFDHPDFEILRFPDRYFGSVLAHTRMMLDRAFYETFLDYDYILFHHLDALVLAPGLEEWCSLGYDFIGAPRIAPGIETPEVVGNGGFALRRVRSFLRVLNSKRYSVDPDVYWERITAGVSPAGKLARLPLRYLKRLRILNGIHRDIALSLAAGAAFEDIFMTERAQWYDPSFRFAPSDVALRFAFDELPRVCYEMNDHQLPFGCHAWYRQDREFWEPFLLRSCV